MRSRSFPLHADRRRMSPRRVTSGLFVRSPLRSIVAAAFVVAVGIATALTMRTQLGGISEQVANLRGFPLLIAAVVAPLAPATTAAAWHSVLASRGLAVRRRDVWGCYGIGSVANTFVPGRAGDALRIELVARRLEHPQRRWLACGISASVGLAQSAVLGGVLAAGAFAGALPLWATVPALAVPLTAWGAGRLALRRGPRSRVACLAAPSTLSASAWGRLLCWIGASAVARIVAVAAVLAALAVPHPLPTAIVAICGLAAGHLLPFAPGFAGMAAATMTVALGRSGVPASTALAAAVSFHALETAAGLLFALGGWLAMRSRRTAALPDRRAALAAGAP